MSSVLTRCPLCEGGNYEQIYEARDPALGSLVPIVLFVALPAPSYS